MEPCQSGLTYLFAKEAGCKSPREFESRRFRSLKRSENCGSEEVNCFTSVRDSKDFSLASLLARKAPDTVSANLAASAGKIILISANLSQTYFYINI